MVQLQDFNDHPPSRKPLWIALAAIVALGAGWLLLRPRPEPVPARPEAHTSATVKNGADPALAGPAKADVAAAPVPQKEISAAAASNPPPAVSNPPPAAAATHPVAAGGIPASAIEEAEAMEKAGRLVEARGKYVEILERYPGAANAPAVEEKAGALALELILKPYPMPEKQEYVVSAGDSLDRIAKKFGCTKELMITNNLIARPALIKRGDRYRVLSGTFKVSVNKTRNDLVLTLNGKFLKRYRIGTGKFGATPAGTFVISDRVREPVWWKADGKAVPFGHPENILGTHWLKLEPTGSTPAVSGYGIHGTWDDASIGKAESAGCVRMHNTDVEQLYVMLPPGTEVVIQE